MLTFLQALEVVATLGSDFKGRASRSEYWWTFLACVAVRICSSVFLIIPFIGSFISLAAVITTYVVLVFVGIRRLHDLGLPGFLVIADFLPGLNILMLVIYAIPGSAKVNQYGVSPLTPGFYQEILKNSPFRPFRSKQDFFAEDDFCETNTKSSFWQNFHNQQKHQADADFNQPYAKTTKKQKLKTPQKSDAQNSQNNK